MLKLLINFVALQDYYFYNYFLNSFPLFSSLIFLHMNMLILFVVLIIISLKSVEVKFAHLCISISAGLTSDPTERN
jgi:hypothetical protein